MLGQCDPGLSDLGKSQAAAIKLPPVEVIYTSRLRRAIETGFSIARDSTPVILDDDLNEVSYGDWDGRRWRDIEREYPTLAAAKLQDWIAVTPPGGEEWRAFAHRVNRALERARGGPLPAAIVAHLTVNAQIAHFLSGSSLTGFEQRYGEVFSYEI